MAQELPYFRFTVQEWQNGSISIENYEMQGLFISICGYYWVQDCRTTLAQLKKRYKDALVLIDQLIELEIIKHDQESDFIDISFLNRQYDLLSLQRLKKQQAGSKGGASKATNSSKGVAQLQHGSSYKDKDNNKDKDKDNLVAEAPKKIQEREEAFSKLLYPFRENYNDKIISDFFRYWTEKNDNATKMRFEKEKTFEISKRLITWHNRSKDFEKGRGTEKVETGRFSVNQQTVENVVKMKQAQQEQQKQDKTQ